MDITGEASEKSTRHICNGIYYELFSSAIQGAKTLLQKTTRSENLAALMIPGALGRI